MFHLGFQGVRVTVPTVDTVPVETAVTVSGAGSSGANGDYVWSSMGMNYEGPTGFYMAFGTKWEITETGTYYYNNNGDADNVPLTGWITDTFGSPPAPTLSAT